MKSAVLVLSLLATLCRGEDLSNPHVINGEEAKPHSFPHQVALRRREYGDQYRLGCGASLLSEKWVITAAHCVDHGVESTVVTLGAHDVSKNEGTQQNINISKVIVHPNWDIDGIKHDIALIELDKTAQIDGEIVKPIRLPKLSDKEKSFYNYEATMSGWGRFKTTSYESSPTLQTMTERVMSNMVCKAAFLFLLVEKTNICIHGIRLKGGCHGDSGGPLIVTEEDGERTLVGIVSFGLPTCTLWPSVFTRVSSYVDWIHEQTGLPVRE